MGRVTTSSRDLQRIESWSAARPQKSLLASTLISTTKRTARSRSGWKGIALPYRAFAKDQRVSRTAVVENKRLGHALLLVKAQQDVEREIKVLTNSEKDGYKRRPRQVYGSGYIDSTRERHGIEVCTLKPQRCTGKPW